MLGDVSAPDELVARECHVTVVSRGVDFEVSRNAPLLSGARDSEAKLAYPPKTAFS
jgi:hypothetical protein